MEGGGYPQTPFRSTKSYHGTRGMKTRMLSRKMIMSYLRKVDMSY